MAKVSSIKECITISLAFENFLSLLFGYDNYSNLSDTQKKSEWKEIIMEITAAIEKSLEQNVIYTDEYQREEIAKTLSTIKSNIISAKTLNDCNRDMILGISKLMFNVLGTMPYHWNKKTVNKAENWKLDNFRTMTFSQNCRQKANLIIYLSDYADYNKQMPSKRELQKKLALDFKGDDLQFINWFKENFTTSYLQIF